jgi:hypothetical protein
MMEWGPGNNEGRAGAYLGNRKTETRVGAVGLAGGGTAVGIRPDRRSAPGS